MLLAPFLALRAGAQGGWVTAGVLTGVALLIIAGALNATIARFGVRGLLLALLLVVLAWFAGLAAMTGLLGIWCAWGALYDTSGGGSLGWGLALLCGALLWILLAARLLRAALLWLLHRHPDLTDGAARA